MIERFAARARGLDENRQVGASLLLADELGEALRAQLQFRRVLFAAFRRDQPLGRGAHLICLSRLYLFGSNSLMPTDIGPVGPGTITRALRS